MIDTQKLYSDLAKTLPKTSILRCRMCAQQDVPSQEQLERYFRQGWPLHCGYTMYLETDGAAAR